jgi:hypothetical protein
MQPTTAMHPMILVIPIREHLLPQEVQMRAFCELLTTKDKFHQNLNWSNDQSNDEEWEASFPSVREIWVDKSCVFDVKENKIMAEGIMLTLRECFIGGHMKEKTMLKCQLEDIATNWLRYFTRCDMNCVQTLVSLYALADFNPELQLELEKLLCECDDPSLVCGIGYRYIDDDEMAICTKLEAEESKQ